jgi:N-acetylmuramoyl-L-alanine amidase
MEMLLSILALLLGMTGFGDDPGSGGVKTRDGSGVTIPLPPPDRARPIALPPISGARDPKRPLVVIDPGHGGGDPGAVSPFGNREKDVTLAIARAVHADLAASARVRVALTRADDRHISLPERYEVARRLGADLFISIHADAAPRNDGARGATIYTLSEVASDREAALLAARENGAQAIGGADFSRDRGVNRILIDLAQREAMGASADFARLLYREASPDFAFQPDYHRFASLIVLKAPDIPSVLFESGYLTNREDEAFIRSEDGRRRIAAGMRKAIETHFAVRALAASR